MTESKPSADSGPSSWQAFLATVRALTWKDFTVERHTGQMLTVMLVFSIAATIVVNLALYGNLSAARDVSPGFLWIVILLAGTLGLNRSLISDQENNSIEAILMAPVDRGAIYLGKVVSVLAFTLLTELLLLPFFIAFFNKPFWRPQVLLILVLGTIGYVAAGVLVTAMTVQTRSKDVLLPVLLLPLSLPSVLASAQVVAAYVAPELPAISEVRFPFALVVAFDVLMLLAGYFSYQFVVEE